MTHEMRAGHPCVVGIDAPQPDRRSSPGVDGRAETAFFITAIRDRTRAGQSIGTEDAEIAAISLLHGLPLATRNVKNFDNIAGLRVVNPWNDA